MWICEHVSVRCGWPDSGSWAVPAEVVHASPTGCGAWNAQLSTGRRGISTALFRVAVQATHTIHIMMTVMTG